MKQRTRGIAPLPAETSDALKFIYDEVVDLGDAISELNAAFRTVSYVPPVKKQIGMIRFADGTSWNPGGGAGYYFWDGAAWIKMST